MNRDKYKCEKFIKIDFFFTLNRDAKVARQTFVVHEEEIMLDSIYVVFQTSITECLTSITNYFMLFGTEFFVYIKLSVFFFNVYEFGRLKGTGIRINVNKL